MALLTTQVIDRNSSVTAVTFTAADAGLSDTFNGEEGLVLLAQNASGAPRTIAMVAVACSHGRTVNQVQTVADGTIAAFSPSDLGIWNDGSGLITVTTDVNTSVTYAVVRLK